MARRWRPSASYWVESRASANATCAFRGRSGAATTSSSPWPAAPSGRQRGQRKQAAVGERDRDRAPHATASAGCSVDLPADGQTGDLGFATAFAQRAERPADGQLLAPGQRALKAQRLPSGVSSTSTVTSPSASECAPSSPAERTSAASAARGEHLAALEDDRCAGRIGRDEDTAIGVCEVEAAHGLPGGGSSRSSSSPDSPGAGYVLGGSLEVVWTIWRRPAPVPACARSPTSSRRRRA